MDEVSAQTRIAVLCRLGEYLAAGACEDLRASPLRRAARGLRRHFESAPLPDWDGALLYPAGGGAFPSNAAAALRFSYSHGLVLESNVLQQKLQNGTAEEVSVLTELEARMRDLYAVGTAIPNGHNLGGGGYTHGILPFGRILVEGLGGYATRLERRTAAGGGEPDDFGEAMRDVLAGLFALQVRTGRKIEEGMLRHPEWNVRGQRLRAALARVPREPARNFHEALLAVNWLWYVDGSDNLGRFDQDLGRFLEHDLAAGLLDRGEALDLVRLLWDNFNACSGWNVALGGSDREGRPAYNPLTEIALEAARGKRRPNLALRVRRDMPDRTWDRVVEVIGSGCGLPALYNEEAYLQAVGKAFPGIDGDRFDYAFGGCTETMIHGCSNVGSIDGGLNLLGVLAGTIRTHLAATPTLDAFMERVLQDIRAALARTIAFVNTDQRRKAADQPQPLRSLLIGDCLERGLEYNAGGARYNGGVINLGGLANVADALAALQALVFEGPVAAAEMCAALAADFQGHTELLQRVRACPKFGNDDDRADQFAVRVAGAAFDEIRRHRCWRGGGTFLPACILFVVYADAGVAVPATPDGRRAGAPIGDSIGAVQGRDRQGPTALLKSVCKLPLQEATGTPVLNVRFAQELLQTAAGRTKFKDFVRTFFAMGGMQIQISVIDQGILREAMAHPEKHGGLIVRIGGYSEYFNRLSPALQQAVLERTEHR